MADKRCADCQSDEGTANTDRGWRLRVANTTTIEGGSVRTTLGSVNDIPAISRMSEGVPWYPTCAARELRIEELRRNVPSHMRKDVPLFVSPTGSAWTHAALNKVFFKMLSALVGAEKAGRYSIHSFRIYLACALLAAGASNGTIQTMLRWKSEDALRIYARISEAAQG